MFLMLRKLEFFMFLLCLLCTFNSNGQSSSDSVRVLKTVVVTQSRLNDHVIAAFDLPIDSAMLSLASNGSVTDMLRKQGLGHIRSYGASGLTLASFRGTGSSHTAVLWNGINLISPLNGQLDLSLLPAVLFDDAAIQTGGSTSLSGNGSIGANIHLNNNTLFGQGLNVAASSHLGSFGHQFYHTGISASNDRLGTSTKIYFTETDNDFEFTNRSQSPPEKQRREHSGFEQYGLLQQLHWQSHNAGIFSLKLWYQKSLYETPNPTAIPRASQATEENKSYRALVGWNLSKGNLNLNYQGAFIRHELDYSDPLLDIMSNSVFNSTVHNIETNLDFKNNTQLTSGIHYTWEHGVATAFGPSPTRNRIAFFSAYKINSFEKWELSISGREEIVNGDATPFSPAISAKYNIDEKLYVFTNLSRNYRIPTFNDLYWKGGSEHGNPGLKTETSLSAEGGLGFANQILTFKAVGFSNHVDNWIAWTPVDSRVWMPLNLKKVWSRGFEAQGTAAKKIIHTRLKATGLYSFTKSTNEDVYDNGNPNEIGKQLLLTPLHEGSITMEAEWRKYILRIVNSYTGRQFNDSDNTRSGIVEDYLITNIWLSKVVQRKQLKLTFTAEVNNAFDVEYVGRPGYPLPGRNYKAGIQLNFYKQNKV
jgi:vitamin B12 transporter